MRAPFPIVGNASVDAKSNMCIKLSSRDLGQKPLMLVKNPPSRRAVGHDTQVLVRGIDWIGIERFINMAAREAQPENWHVFVRLSQAE